MKEVYREDKEMLIIGTPVMNVLKDLGIANERGIAEEMKKGCDMSIDDAEYRWVDDRIKMMEKIKNGAEGGRMLSKDEMSAANALWKVYGS